MAKDFEKEEFQQYFIPNNYDDDGKILDFCEKRNLVEGCIFGGIPAWIIIQVSGLPTETVLVLVVFICVPIFLICCMGINGDPLTIFLKNVLEFLKKRKHNKMRFKRIDKSDKPKQKKSPPVQKKTKQTSMSRSEYDRITSKNNQPQKTTTSKTSTTNTNVNRTRPQSQSSQTKKQPAKTPATTKNNNKQPPVRTRPPKNNT